MASAVSKANSFFQHYIEETAVVQAALYASGDLIANKISLVAAVEGDADQRGPVGGLIQSVIITDLGAQSAALDVVFFDTDPTSTTFTLNAAFDVDDLDLVNIVGVAQVTTYAAFSDNSVGQALQLAIPFVLPSGNTLYAAIVSRGTPTYASTSDLTIRVGVLKG